ncbi:thioredoxin-dependent thiol peroxidase [Thermosipho atlanticus]|uniref:thioredoxin-dependent peroxiredoxin n=1 Tax=Thermosipho atlanticus DSM 15807 TaxID=1123380 RepID=A0A1M5SNW4_9BACT|nr:thioredoxin-dependent thiol peroxidase [Thermosipho atlanticus]SHH40150.1 peroxiredoxin Q/BCP [Thermosipho atlanticus DSM 15807]
MIDKKAPNFCLPDKDGNMTCLNDFKGQWIVLYFYPKDNTPGCTREALDFSQYREDFDKENAVIIGISKDSSMKHKKFIEKYKLNIILLSDEEHKVHELYGAWGKKKNYGKEYYGTIRTTFLIDPEGKIRHVWRKVKVNGHVKQVLEKLKELKGGIIMEDKVKLVLDVLKNEGKEMRPGEIAKKAGLDSKEVSKIIKKLKEEGKVESPKRCYYKAK